jgi:phage-related protein
MTKPLSVLTSIEKGNLSSDQPFLVCLDIAVINPATGLTAETLYLVRNTEDITYNGHIYTAAAFDVGFKSESGTMPQVSMTIQDHSRAVQARMQAYNGGIGFMVKMMVINHGDLTQPPEIVEYFEITNATASDYTAQFTLGAENTLALPFPRRRQTKRFCQFRYKGSSCGYRDIQHLVSPGTAGNYAWAPDSVNLNPAQNWIGYSEDLALWTDLSSSTVTSNAFADPNGNLTMDTLTDDSAGFFEGRQYAMTVPNDGATYKLAFLVRKDLAATHRAGANFSLQGGTPVSVNMRYALDGTNAAVCTVVSYDTYNWLVSGSITNNTTGNVTLLVQLYGATAATKSGADNAVAVGSATYGWMRVQRSNVLLPYLKTTTGVTKKGNIDVRAKVRMTDWTPVARSQIMSKWDVTANNRSFFMAINTDGTINVNISMLGSDFINAASTVAVGAANGTIKWIRWTWTQSTSVSQFFVSDDGITWTQLGTNVTTTSVGGIFVGTGILEVASRGVGATELMAGDVYLAELRNDVDGAIVGSFDARDITVGSLTGVSSVTGDLWTVATSGGSPASIVYDAGYPKTTCDLTLQGDNGCASHNNSVNFGGFPGLNNSNNKYA